MLNNPEYTFTIVLCQNMSVIQYCNQDTAQLDRVSVLKSIPASSIEKSVRLIKSNLNFNRLKIDLKLSLVSLPKLVRANFCQ